MQRTELTLLSVLGALALFVGAEARHAPAAPEPHRTAAVSEGAVAARVRTPKGAKRDGLLARSAGRAPAAIDVRSANVRRRLELAAPGTYIGEILLDRDSALTRWPERTAAPLTVWIAGAEGHVNWRPSYGEQVRSAFEAWQGVGIPVRFAFVADSAAADVHVTWTDRFREPISGKTVWSRDDRWWIVDADITLALHHRDGAPLDAAQVRAIALHEVGHLLGLDHTVDPANIMAAKVRVRELSPADQATVRLLYSVPAGRVR